MNLIFWGLVLVVLGGGFAFSWVASLAAIFVGKRRESKLLKWGGLACFATVNLAALAFGGLFVACVVTTVADSRPERVYERTFHEKPTPDVAHIQADGSDIVIDSGSTYLRFEASRATFERLIPNGASRVTADEYATRSPVSSWEVPAWWDRVDPETTEIYFLLPEHGEHSSSEVTVMTYDPHDGVVQYRFHWMD